MLALKEVAIVACLVIAVGNGSKLKDLFQPRYSETLNDRLNKEDGEFWSTFERSKVGKDYNTMYL